MQSEQAPVRRAAQDILCLVKGQVVYRQGDPVHQWFEVVDGLVRTCRFYHDGQRQVTGFHFPGDEFGLDSGAYWSTAEVMSPVATVRRHAPAAPAPGADGARPELVRALLRAEQRAILLGRRTAYERVAAFLLLVATRAAGARVVPLPMTREDIADYLGLTSDTVTRMIRVLERRGVVVFQGPHRFGTPDRARLVAAAACGGDEDGCDDAAADDVLPFLSAPAPSAPALAFG